MDIRFYDENHNILKIENQFISSNWQIKFADYGDFLCDFGRNEKLFKLLKNNDFVYIMQDNKFAIVTGLEYSDTLKVYGRSLNYILCKLKPLKPQIFTNINVETIVKTIVDNAFSNVSDYEFEKINLTQTTTFEIADIETPIDSLQRLLQPLKLGFKVYIKNKKWCFKIIPSQEKNLVLSESLKNATEIYYSENIDNYASNSVILNEDSTITEIQTDVKSGIMKWYNTSKDLEELKNSKKEKNIELKTRKINFEKDYVLGDILRVKKNGEEYKKMVMEVIFFYENNNVGERPILE